MTDDMTETHANMAENTPDTSPEIEDCMAELSALASYFGAGLGDDETTPAQFSARVKWGVDFMMNKVTAERDALRARVKALEEAIRDANDELTMEINPSNYSHYDVCLLNDQATSAILILRAALEARHDQPDQGGGQ